MPDADGVRSRADDTAFIRHSRFTILTCSIDRLRTRFAQSPSESSSTKKNGAALDEPLHSLAFEPHSEGARVHMRVACMVRPTSVWNACIFPAAMSIAMPLRMPNVAMTEMRPARVSPG